MRIQPQTKSQAQFYYFFYLSCLEDGIPRVWKRENTTSCPLILNNSIDYSETNMTIIKQIKGECSFTVEAIISVLSISR